MRVILYATSDCGLCDAFHFELLDLQAELGFGYEKRHLSESDALYAEFSGHFPVVDITTTGTDEPVRLASPTSQRQLREQIRQSAGLPLPEQAR